MENQRRPAGLFSSLSRVLRRRLSSSSRGKSSGSVQQIIDDSLTINHDSNRSHLDTSASNTLPARRPPEPNDPAGSQNAAGAAELMHFHASAVSLLQNNNIYVNFSNPGHTAMTNERRALSKHGWYWGSITLTAAQRKLNGRANGSFLVRDSHTGPFQFSISFRSNSMTLHTRIDFIAGYWTIFGVRRYKTMVDLIEDIMREEGILCYVPSKLGPDYPIQLRHPVSRFVEASLQHLCRLAIRSHLEIENCGSAAAVEQLPLPKLLIDYLQETTYDSL